MSFFRQVSMWSLRALLVWGAVEAGGHLYEAGVTHVTSLTRIAGYRSAMARLEDRARAGEAQAAAAQTIFAEANGSAWVLPVHGEEPPSRAAARALREELIQLGAEAPVVDGTDVATAEGITRVTLTARWREPVETSPVVLHGLAGRFPAFSVERLSLERGDRVTTEAVFSMPVRAAPHVEASR